MNIQKEKTLFIAFLENEFPITVADLKSQGVDLLSHFNTEWETWQAAQAVPEGFVLVPKEPTAKQNREGVKKFTRHRNENTWACDAIDDIYKAMIEAQEPANEN